MCFYMVLKRESVTSVANLDIWLENAGSGEGDHLLHQELNMEAEVVEDHSGQAPESSMVFVTTVAKEVTRKQTVGCWRPMPPSVPRTEEEVVTMKLEVLLWRLLS